MLSQVAQLNAYHYLIKESFLPFHLILLSFQCDLVLKAQGEIHDYKSMTNYS